MEEFPAVSQFITGAKMILTEPEKRWQMWEIYTAVQFAVSRLLNVTALKSIFLKLFRAHVTAAARVDFIIDDHDETQQQPKKQIILNLFQSWTDEVKWNRSWAKASSSRKRMCYLNI